MAFSTYSVIWCSELLFKSWVYQTKTKLRPVNFFLKITFWHHRNGLMWKKYCKTLGTTSVPYVKVFANQRAVFGHISNKWYILSLIDTHIWPNECTWYTSKIISFIIIIFGWEIWVSLKPKLHITIVNVRNTGLWLAKTLAPGSEEVVRV